MNPVVRQQRHEAYVARLLRNVRPDAATVIALRWGLNELNGAKLDDRAIAGRLGKRFGWVRARASEARDDLHRVWHPRILGHARKLAPFHRNGLTVDDLSQIGSLKFYTVFDRWDLSHPGHNGWMHGVIKASMNDALRSKQTVVQLPKAVWRLRTEVARATQGLTQELGREPTLEEVADAVGYASSEIVELRVKSALARSLNELTPDVGDLALELADPDSSEFVDLVATRLERRQTIEYILAQMRPATAAVVRLRWGLNSIGYELVNKEIAAEVQKSDEWVRTRLRQAERLFRLLAIEPSSRSEVAITPADLQAMRSSSLSFAWFNLTGKRIAHAELSGVDFTGAILSSANLVQSDLSGAFFSAADLTGVHFTGADLAGADFTGADLTGADFTGADLTGADFTGADLTGAILPGFDLSDTSVATIDPAQAVVDPYLAGSG